VRTIAEHESLGLIPDRRSAILLWVAVLRQFTIPNIREDLAALWPLMYFNKTPRIPPEAGPVGHVRKDQIDPFRETLAMDEVMEHE
jgi:hypothetical protein